MANEWDSALEDFIEYRRTESSKQAFGAVAEKRLRAKCQRLHDNGYDVTELIDHALIAGWLSVYPKEDFKRKPKVAAHGYGPELSIVGVKVDKEKASAAIAEARRAAK